MSKIIREKDPQSAAARFAEALIEVVRSKERVHIALSGGSTPKILFELLAKDFRGKVDWNEVHFYWGDERCVPPDHPESNFLMTKSNLLDHIEIPEGNIHRIKGEEDPEKEAVRYGDFLVDNMKTYRKLPRFDLIMLGLGTDGHTASIFPDQMDLLSSEEVCAVARHPESGQKRVTLTGTVINNAAEVAYLVSGKSKAEKVREILQQKGEYASYPASHIDPHDGNLVWYLDEAAASLLP